MTRAPIDPTGSPWPAGKGSVAESARAAVGGPSAGAEDAKTTDAAGQAEPAERPAPPPPMEQTAAQAPASRARHAARPAPRGPVEGHGPVERVMSTVIRKLAWSRLANPRIALAVSGLGLLLGALVGAFAPNTATLPIRLPLSVLPPWLLHENVLTMVILYIGDILSCLGLAGMLWAHSQGWRPDPRKLLVASACIVAVFVSLTPVGSSDTASYASYGRIAALGGNPYLTGPHVLKGTEYYKVVGSVWKNQVSVYGPIATWIQRLAATIGGANAATTIWIVMILNGLAFIGVGVLLLKTSDDPTRATLFWVANPVLIQQLVSGGHLDTFVAAVSICAIQVARRMHGWSSDVLVGVLLGVAIGIKANAVLVAVGLAWPMLMRREWARTARVTAVSVVTVAALYSSYGITAIKPLVTGAKWVILPSPWRIVQAILDVAGVSPSTVSLIITVLWPIAMIIVAWLIYQRISSDQPDEVVAPFALSFAWVLVAPWVFPWYAALAWVTLTQVPRNRMTRWLTIVTVLLAIWHSGGGQGQVGHV